MTDTAKLTAHIGGMFLYSRNPEKVADFYRNLFDWPLEHWEAMNAWGLSLPYTDVQGSGRYIVWSVMHSDKRPQLDAEQRFITINYRVNNLEHVLNKAQSMNLAIKGPETHDEGIFAWVNDPDGNRVEVWQDGAPT